MREYTDRIRVWIKPGDKEKIRKRMAEAGIRNMSAYIRKMAIDGYVIKLDLSDVKEVSRLLRINANNINQYAKRANRGRQQSPFEVVGIGKAFPSHIG